MGIRYGNESQWTAFKPECGFFVQSPVLHYTIAVYLPVVEISAVILNAWIIFVLISGGPSNKLLQQAQHVYVLGSAITNVLCASIGILGFWLDQFVFPCVYKGLIVCAVKNLFHLGGGFQLIFNVCLICYDRYRLVTFGAQYKHDREVRRAKWALFLTGTMSFLLFVVPEVTIPLTTGQLLAFDHPADGVRCLMSQAQVIRLWIFGSFNFLDVLSIIMILVPFIFIMFFTSLTTYKLFVIEQRKAAAAGGSNHMADYHKLVRASLVMFGMVAALMLAWFPYGFGLCLFEANNNAISWETIMILIVLLDAAPLLDPFAFALTLPKMRARARRTKIGRAFTNLLTLTFRRNKVDVEESIFMGSKRGATMRGIGKKILADVKQRKVLQGNAITARPSISQSELRTMAKTAAVTAVQVD